MLSAQNISKSYWRGQQELKILEHIDFEVGAGENVSIVGPSGAGKSTLLHILGTLDRPTDGRVFFEGTDLFSLGEDAMAQFRNRTMGFVFQFHHLLSEFTALENVALPLRIQGLKAREAQGRAEKWLMEMGLASRVHHYPSEMSGGEQQRVAIARALVCEPKILFADEPTGNLDSKNSRMVQDLMFEIQAKLGLTLIVVTHDSQFAHRFGRRLHLADGRWQLEAPQF